MTGRKIFNAFKFIINVVTFFIRLLPLFVRTFLWNCMSGHNQIIYSGLRFCILKASLKECGTNVKVGSNVRIINWKNLSIKSNVSIHDNCYIDAMGGITIGENVSIAHASSILSSNHSWDNPMIPIKYNPIILDAVTIEDDVWIGCGVRILSGVVVKKRSIVAAGAVVNKSFEGSSIIGGVPVKLIKKI